MKRIFTRAIALSLSSLLVVSLTACSSSTSGTDTSSNAASGDTVEVSFWCAPQQVQYDFWSNEAGAFNATGTTVNGKPVNVSVQKMPESPSSEAGILNALATGSAPTMSENISRGFATTLADSDAIYPLENESWYQDVVTNRHMEDSMPSWEIDGHQYVIPIYVNPIVWQWNSAALRDLGFTKTPATVQDIQDVITAFREQSDTMKTDGVDFVYYRPQLLRSDQWWERWYDFENTYEGFSGGQPFVEDGQLLLDPEITNQVFEFYGMFGDTLCTQEITDPWTGDKIPFLAAPASPWDIQSYDASGMTYGLDGTYVYGPNIVENEGDTPYCFGDSKGISFYKAANISQEQHDGASAFMAWLYNADNADQTDLSWLETTTMLPVRSDLATNPTFTDFMTKYPALEDLAQYVPYAIPSMADGNMSDIQTALGDAGLVPYINETSTLKDFNVPDASSYVSAAFDAMCQAGNLTLPQ